MASLNEKRTFFHLSAIGAHLYAVGGRNSAGELATVEKYHPKENQVQLRFRQRSIKINQSKEDILKVILNTITVVKK